MTQRDLAKNLGIGQTMVSRYEKDPGAMQADLLHRWITVVGLTMDELYSTEQPSDLKVDPGNPYADFHQSLNGARYYIENQAPQELPALTSQNNGQKRETAELLPSKEDLVDEIERLAQKPNVMMAGEFDTGKSFIANSLMGKTVLPVAYQPATEVIIVARHLDDRPAGLNQEAYFLKEDIWKNSVLDVSQLDSTKAIKENEVHSGPTDFLKTYAVRLDKEDRKARGKQAQEIHTAVVYVDAPILKACNIIDLPGFSDEPDSEDESKAFSALPYAHIILYASRIKGHLSATENIRIGHILRQLVAPEDESNEFPALGNFFIVASHADRSVSDSDVETIRIKSIERLHAHLDTSGIIRRRQKQLGGKVTEDALRTQWFPFWAENTQRSEPLVEALGKFLGETYPVFHIRNASKELTEVRKEAAEHASQASRTYGHAAESSADSMKRLRQMEKEASKVLRELETGKGAEKIVELIESLRADSKKDIKGKIKYRLGEDYLANFVKDNFTDKSEAKEQASALVLEEIHSKVEDVLEEKGEELARNIESYLDKIDQRFDTVRDYDGKLNIPFNTVASFAGGVAGAGAMGALAFWAAQMGPLGGYILVSKGVAALAAMGFATGGTAATVAAVSAMGGPVVLALGVGAAVGLVTWRLMSTSWEERLARKLRSHFKEKNLKKKILEQVDQYWDDTNGAFKAGVEGIKDDVKLYRKKIITVQEDKEMAQKLAEDYDVAHIFYKAIPLVQPEQVIVDLT